MELLVLVLLYYLSQNPDFAESAKPLMAQLKNSEQMLKFLNDLANFSKTFGAFQSQSGKTDDGGKKEEKKSEKTKSQCNEKEKAEKGDKEKNPQSPTAGIADDFIEQILESYLKKH